MASNHSNMNTLTALFFVLLFIVAAIIIIDKTKAIEYIKNEYSTHVDDQAKEQIEKVVPLSDLRTQNVQYSTLNARSNM